ncbi:D-psicose 3-epimerase [Peribacillus simplex]
MIKFGVHSSYGSKSWDDIDVKRSIKRFSEIGFDVVELFIPTFIDQSDEELKEIKKIGIDAGVKLVYSTGLDLQYDLSSEDASVRQQGINYIKNVLKKIHFMDGDFFGGVNYAGWGKKLNKNEFDRSKYVENSLNSMREIIETAEDLGITYCAEVLNRFETMIMNTASEGVEFVNRLNSPNAKIMLDTFHMNIEEKSIRDAILTAGGKLANIHLGERNRQLPGQGDMDFDEIFSSLRDINYQGTATIESFIITGGQIGKDVGLFRDLSNGAENEQLDDYLKESLKYIKQKAKCVGLN